MNSRGKTAYKTKVADRLVINMQYSEKGPSSSTLYRNQFKEITVLSLKPETLLGDCTPNKCENINVGKNLLNSMLMLHILASDIKRWNHKKMKM